MELSSNVATQVFAAVWSLTQLGALRSVKEVEYPFDRVLKGYASEKNRDLLEVVSLLQTAAGFKAKVAQMLLRDAPWNSADESSYYDSDDTINRDLALMLGSDRGTLSYVRANERSKVIAIATLRQLAQLFDGVLVACFQSSGEQTQVAPEGIAAILATATRLANVEPPSPPTEWLRSILDDWDQNFRTRLEANPGTEGFARWLSVAIRTLRSVWTSDARSI